MAGRILPRSFYERPTVEVARDLLGMDLIHGARSGRILEVEAYLPEGDQAAHAWRGRTARTEVLFGRGGHAYVYLVYGMYDCLNVVAEPEGVPGCVLIRSVEGHGDGPGKLTRSLGITRALYGADLTRGPLVIRQSATSNPPTFKVTPRVGLTRSASLPLRFVLEH